MEDFESPLLKELSQTGHFYGNIDEIFKQDILQPEEVKIILKWLPAAYAEDLAAGDTLTRSLMSAKEPFDPSLLIDIYENSDMNYALKSGISLTLACARTLDISKWMRHKLLDEPFAIENYSLIDGLFDKGGFENKTDFMDFLKKIYDKYQSEILLKCFQKYGGQEDLMFLKEKVKTADKKRVKAVQKTIDKMSARKKL